MGVDFFWFRPVQVLNGPAASFQGVEQRGAEPLFVSAQVKLLNCSTL